MIQWGTIHLKISNTWHTITFNAYRNTSYCCIISPTADDSAAKGALAIASGYGTRSKTYSSIVYGTDTIWAGCNWITIGVY